MVKRNAKKEPGNNMGYAPPKITHGRAVITLSCCLGLIAAAVSYVINDTLSREVRVVHACFTGVWNALFGSIAISPLVRKVCRNRITIEKEQD